MNSQDALERKIYELYDSMVPMFRLRVANSHLVFHRKSRIRKKWMRRLGFKGRVIDLGIDEREVAKYEPDMDWLDEYAAEHSELSKDPATREREWSMWESKILAVFKGTPQ